MKDHSVPYQRVLFVCTNKREGDARPSCGLRNSEMICELLKDEVVKRRLKGKVRVMKSGCHDVCEQGPSVMVFPENQCLAEVKTEDVPAIADRYLKVP